jgi:hypothetical protein
MVTQTKLTATASTWALPPDRRENKIPRESTRGTGK